MLFLCHVAPVRQRDELSSGIGKSPPLLKDCSTWLRAVFFSIRDCINLHKKKTVPAYHQDYCLIDIETGYAADIPFPVQICPDEPYADILYIIRQQNRKKLTLFFAIFSILFLRFFKRQYFCQILIT